MKKNIIAVLTLQIIATVLWVIHTGYLRDDYSARQHKLGVQAGREELQGEIIQKGGEVPDGVFVYRDKDLMINLGGDLHDLIVLSSLVVMQGAALILLISLVYSRPCRSEAAHNNETEQVAASDR